MPLFRTAIYSALLLLTACKTATERSVVKDLASQDRSRKLIAILSTTEQTLVSKMLVGAKGHLSKSSSGAGQSRFGDVWLIGGRKPIKEDMFLGGVDTVMDQGIENGQVIEKGSNEISVLTNLMNRAHIPRVGRPDPEETDDYWSQKAKVECFYSANGSLEKCELFSMN